MRSVARSSSHSTSMIDTPRSASETCSPPYCKPLATLQDPPPIYLKPLLDKGNVFVNRRGTSGGMDCTCGDISFRMRHVAANPTSVDLTAAALWLPPRTLTSQRSNDLTPRGGAARRCGKALALKACEGNNRRGSECHARNFLNLVKHIGRSISVSRNRLGL